MTTLSFNPVSISDIKNFNKSQCKESFVKKWIEDNKVPLRTVYIARLKFDTAFQRFECQVPSGTLELTHTSIYINGFKEDLPLNYELFLNNRSVGATLFTISNDTEMFDILAKNAYHAAEKYCYIANWPDSESFEMNCDVFDAEDDIILSFIASYDEVEEETIAVF